MSNEALKTERYPGLLLYLIGGNLTVIVDETHHGIHRKQNMIGYLRHYRLHWVLIALLSVAGLFVWRSALPLIPPVGNRMDLALRAEETRNAAQGMTNLLRRSISPQRLLGVCLDQWEKAFGNNLRYPHTRRERARRIIEQAGTASDANANPVNGYRAISRILLEDQPHE